MYVIVKKSRNSRRYDLDHLAKDSFDPKRAKETAEKISKESGKIADMREALVKAHRQNDKNEIKDIHDFVESHKDYR
jgi:hypothetical protein